MKGSPISRIRLLSKVDLIVVLLLVISLAAGLGMRRPSPPDEPRFVLAARQMIETGEWLLPHRGIELYAEKPPVFMWIQALTYQAVGIWEIAFLLPSLIAALLTLGLVYSMGRGLWGPAVGRCAVLCLFTTVQFGLMAKRAQIDMVLVAMTTASLWGLVRHLLQGGSVWALGLAGFMAGLGTVTKGVGFLPLLMLVPFFAFRNRFVSQAAAFGLRESLVIVGGFALGVAVWLGPLFYELARQQGGEIESYAQELLFKQTATRYVASWHHVQPWWYFLQVIFTLWLPGALLLPFLAKLWWPGVKRFDMKTVLLLGWVVLVLIFFSVSPGKREVYILPALPAVCLMAAPYVSSLLARRSCGRLLIAYLLVLVVASAVAAVGLLADQALWRKLLEGRDIAHGSQHALGMWLLALSVGIAAILSWTGVRRAGEAVVVSSALIWFCYGVGFMPALDPYASAAYLMERVEERLGPNDQLAMIGWREQNLLQARRPVTEFGFKAPVEEQKRRAALWISGRPERKFILIPESEADGCIEGAGATRVGQANRVTWLLAPASAIGGSCSAIK